MASTVALIVAIVGIPTSLALAAAPYVAPVIQKRLSRSDPKSPPVVQGQPVPDYADDAIEAWKGRAEAEAARADRAEARIADLERRLSLIESQASRD